MTIAVIPTRNEHETITDLVRAVGKHVDRVYVVDDSDDLVTAWNAGDGGATVLAGKGSIGAAILRGMAISCDEDVLVIDAGGSHDPAVIPLLQSVDSDVVIGSRLKFGSQFLAPSRRKMVTGCVGSVCRTVTGWEIRDWTSGYRLYSPWAVGKLLTDEPKARGHAFQIEALAKIVGGGGTWHEIPITYRASSSSLTRKTAWEAAKTVGVLACR